MIRNLIDIEKMSEDEEKIGSEKKSEVLESAKDENVAETPLNENFTEEAEIKPEKVETHKIKQIAADEIISQLNAKQNEIAEKESSPEPVLEVESPKSVKEILSDDMFLELEEAARKIEAEAEGDSTPETSVGVEVEIEDSKIKRLESELAKIENELLAEKDAEEKLKAEKKSEEKKKAPAINSIFADAEEISPPETNEPETVTLNGDTENTELVKSEEKPFQTDTEPMSKTEAFRKSGMAYTAAIVLLGAVVFMMIIGWGADLLFGTSPWGIVVGIVVGAILGFIQFFRVTSEIFKK